MDQKTKGAWLVNHTNKLRTVTHSHEFENIQVAGKLAQLLSGLAASKQMSLPMSQVETIAETSGISKRLELPVLLQQLGGMKLVQLGTGGIDVLGVTSSQVLVHAATAFDAMAPSAAEQAAIDLAEQVSHAPVEHAYASQYIGDTFHMSKRDASDFLSSSAYIGFIDEEKIDDTRSLIFNGNLFRRDNAQKAAAIASSLTAQDSQKVLQLQASLKSNGCITADETKTLLGDLLFEKLVAMGMIDVSEVGNDKEQVRYVTSPAAFGKFGDPFSDDALDLAKTLVACLKYGMTRSAASRGRIVALTALMRHLLADAEIGPATAIGEDYKVLEFRRVVQLRHAYGDRYFMRLLKKDVGELALQVLIDGDASEQLLPNLPTAAVSRYEPPEHRRVRTRKKQLEPSKRSMTDALLRLRTRGG